MIRDYDLFKFLDDNNCLRDVNCYVEENEIHNYGQEEYLAQLIKYLRKLKKGNVLLLGKAGIGKTALVESLAQAINEKKVPEYLQDKIVLELSLGGAVAGTKYRGEFEEKIQKVLEFVSKRKDIILFIDEIHTVLSAGAAEGALSAADMLKPYLARGEINLIGATTKEEYVKSIKRNKAMDRRFSKINMKEPNILDTINILKSVKENYEDHYGTEINDWEIRNIVLMANFKKGNFPDKALDSLEDYCYAKTES